MPAKRGSSKVLTYGKLQNLKGILEALNAIPEQDRLALAECYPAAGMIGQSDKSQFISGAGYHWEKIPGSAFNDYIEVCEVLMAKLTREQERAKKQPRKY